jgi:hypothetical protein
MVCEGTAALRGTFFTEIDFVVEFLLTADGRPTWVPAMALGTVAASPRIPTMVTNTSLLFISISSFVFEFVRFEFVSCDPDLAAK